MTENQPGQAYAGALAIVQQSTWKVELYFDQGNHSIHSFLNFLWARGLLKDLNKN